MFTIVSNNNKSELVRNSVPLKPNAVPKSHAIKVYKFACFNFDKTFTMLVPIAVYCLTILGVANTDQSFDKLELSQAREIFIWNDTEFYLYSELVSWEEAKVICESENMHLTNLNNPIKTKFISQSVYEAWMTYENMWIGAHRNKNGHWIWTSTNERLSQISLVDANDSFWYPPWINNEVPSREAKNCLAIDRNGHDNPYFVDLNCQLHRSFICEKTSKLHKMQPWSAGVLSNENVEFVLYHGRLSWAEAVSFCRQQGSWLASVENMKMVKKLAIAMMKARPEVEEAWIGANLQDDQWVWIDNGEEIKTIPAEYKDPNGSDNPRNTITPHFPPWFDLKNSPSKNKCVLLDRHQCEQPHFITMRCDRKKNFICMKSKEDEDTQKDVQPMSAIERDRKRYTLYRVETTWEEAKALCEGISDNSTMLNLTDIEEAKFIVKIMADAQDPIDHVWLDGRIVNDEWHWVGRQDDDSVQISTDIDKTGFPPWCDTTIDENMACLNLDRQNHFTPLIYGLECNATQATICVQPVESKDEIVNYKRSSRQDDFTLLKVTKLEDTPISWMEAERACRKEIGKLWKPNFERKESTEAVFGSIMADENKPEVALYHVEGGIYRRNVNAWMHNGRKSQLKTASEPRDGDCLVARTNRTAQEWNWVPVKCHRKLNAQIICEPRCSLTEVPYELEKSSWNCEADDSSIFDHKMFGMGCSRRCSQDRVLQGPERFYCGEKRGWVYNRHPNLRVNSSKCLHLSDGLHLFANIPKDLTTLVFIIDSTRGNLDYYNAAKYLMGNLIEYYRFEATEVTVHVVSIETDSETGDGAVVKVKDFKPTHDCEDIKNQVLLPLIDMNDGFTDYASALLKVESILDKFSFSKSHIVLLAENADERGNWRAVVSSLKRELHIFAIGINGQIPNSQLIELASIVGGVSYAVQFELPSDVVTAVRGLISYYCDDCVCQNTFYDIATDIQFRMGSRLSTESSANTISIP